MHVMLISAGVEEFKHKEEWENDLQIDLSKSIADTQTIKNYYVVCAFKYT